MLDDLEKTVHQCLQQFSGGDLLVESMLLKHLSENFRKRGLKEVVVGEIKEMPNYKLKWRGTYDLAVDDLDQVPTRYLVPSKKKIKDAMGVGEEIEGVKLSLKGQVPYLLPMGVLKLIIPQIKDL